MYLQNGYRIKDTENNLMITKLERGKGKLDGWDKYIHTTVYKIDNKKNLHYSTESHSIFCNNLLGKNLKKNVCVCIYICVCVCVCVCVKLNDCAVHLQLHDIVNQLYFNKKE